MDLARLERTSMLTGSGVLKAFGSVAGKLEAFCSGGGMNFVGDAIWLRNAAEDRDFEIASGRSIGLAGDPSRLLLLLRNPFGLSCFFSLNTRSE